MSLALTLQLCAMLLAVSYALRKAWLELALPLIQFIRKAVHVTDIMIEIPDRLDKLEAITKQLTPNGGTHLHDDIRETRRLLEQHVQDALTWKTNLSHRVLALEDRDLPLSGSTP